MCVWFECANVGTEELFVGVERAGVLNTHHASDICLCSGFCQFICFFLNTCFITWQHTQLIAIFNRRLVNECGSFCVFSVCYHPRVIPNLTGNSSPGEHTSRYFEKFLCVFIHRVEDRTCFVANIFKISYVFCRRNCVTLILNNESPSWLFKPSISQI